MLARLQRGVTVRLASVALVPAAAFAVHQLRYWLAFGGRAGLELAHQGHSYLRSLVPWIVLLMATALGVFLRALGGALGGRRSVSRHTLSVAALWLLCSACLVAIYVSQEFLRGCSPPGIRPGSPASSVPAGGGRFRPRSASGSSSRPPSMALAGCWERCPSAAGAPSRFRPGGLPRRGRRSG